MTAIVISGEAIFLLPFVVPRVFRPTLLDVFGITNLELGTAFSLYGIVAMFSYFAGGPLADRFSVRRLMASALVVTSLGGAYLTTIPPLSGLCVVYAFWGMSTILLFWAALIRATREWGGEFRQGTAYGILDGGRGVVAAGLALAGTYVLQWVLPDDVDSATLAQKSAALQQVIWIFTSMSVLAAVLIWFCVPDSQTRETTDAGKRFSLKHVPTVLRNPAVWLQGVIVVCAYTGYKGADDFGLYSRDVFDFDDVQAARLSTLSLWLRPVTALTAGVVADKIGASRSVLICFAVLAIGDLAIAFGVPHPGVPWMLFVVVAGTSAMVYGLRGIYFALFPEAQVSVALTGTAVGIVSFIGYTPDVFMGPLMGYLTDTFPGALGHQYLFGALAGFAACGHLATLAFQWIGARRSAQAHSPG
ncbi:MAG: MFS transporter [Planctomycetota bacterium]|nr:MAG: MFS transporter [Planctomycetota bacterium]REK30397.1 MAG: MFS transporter [Planctomycetota bacterium]